MNNIFNKTYTITTNYLDRYDDLTPMGLLDLFQDAAGRHAYQLSAGYDDMLALGYYWVIVRNEVEIIKETPFGHDVAITTWPLVPTRFYFDRMYELKDEAGETCVIARSRWLIIDEKHRRMQPSSVYHYPLADFIDRQLFKEDFPSLINVPLSEDIVLSYSVRQSDIDHNLHFNNARYAELVYNALDIKSKNSIKHFYIYYHSECRLGDVIQLVKLAKEDEVYIAGYKEAQLVFTSKVIWRSKQ